MVERQVEVFLASLPSRVQDAAACQGAGVRTGDSETRSVVAAAQQLALRLLGAQGMVMVPPGARSEGAGLAATDPGVWGRARGPSSSLWGWRAGGAGSRDGGSGKDPVLLPDPRKHTGSGAYRIPF